MSGAADVEKLVAEWPPERTESVTRIPAARLREVVGHYARAGYIENNESAGKRLSCHALLRGAAPCRGDADL